jgi:hypothetical protein
VSADQPPAAGVRTVRELQRRLAYYDKFPNEDPMGRRRTRLMTGLPFPLVADMLPPQAVADADLRTRWGTVPPEQQIRDYLRDCMAPNGPLNNMLGNLDALVWMLGDPEYRQLMSMDDALDRIQFAARLVATPGA